MQLIVNNDNLIKNMESVWGEWTGDIKFSDVKNKIEEKNTFDYDFENKTCAMVANSSILLNKEYGEFIDSHDYVVRMNLARTEGFEKHVGSKTSFRFLAAKSFASLDLSRFSAYDINYLPSLKNEHFIIKNLQNWGACSRGTVRHLNNNNRISYLTKDVEQECNKMINSEASTGFMSMWFFINFFDNINVFGFNHYSESLPNQHYFEKVEPLPNGSYLGFNHPFQSEKNIFKQVEKQGRIKIYE